MNGASRNTASYNRGHGRIRYGASIDCGGRSVPSGRSAHSRCNGHYGRDHDPMSHLSLLRSLSLALGRVTAKAGARRSYSSAVVKEQLRCRVRATAPGADFCRSAYEHRPARSNSAAASPIRPSCRVRPFVDEIARRDCGARSPRGALPRRPRQSVGSSAPEIPQQRAPETTKRRRSAEHPPRCATDRGDSALRLSPKP